MQCLICTGSCVKIIGKTSPVYMAEYSTTMRSCVCSLRHFISLAGIIVLTSCVMLRSIPGTLFVTVEQLIQDYIVVSLHYCYTVTPGLSFLCLQLVEFLYIAHISIREHQQYAFDRRRYVLYLLRRSGNDRLQIGSCHK